MRSTGRRRTLPAPKDVPGPAMRPVSLAKGLDRKAEHELVREDRLAGDRAAGRVPAQRQRGRRLRRPGHPGANRYGLRRDGPTSSISPRPAASPNIPRTLHKLHEGGELRMVLLGDSIMGNTSASSFELLLMRDYPKCKIVKIASLRSSTGCKYYREDNRVEDYVLKHNPDLLVIGGISNGGDAEAVRSVIQQVRDSEAGYRSAAADARLRHPARRAHPDVYARDRHDDEQFPLQHAEGCGGREMRFFDMTGPWWAYIQNSGKTYGWFMGDAVHANQPRLPDHRPAAGNLVQGV